jgi:hypothetical protein
MPRIPATTNAQSTFLRAFRTSPTGPAPDQWPSPAVFRRWLRRPAFATALRSLRDALRTQADFHLASAAAQAVQGLATQPELAPQDFRRLAELLRLAHQRQRFPTEAKLASPATFDLRDEILDLEATLESFREERERKARHPAGPAAPQDEHKEEHDDDNDDSEDDDSFEADDPDEDLEADCAAELERLRALANPARPPAAPANAP